MDTETEFAIPSPSDRENETLQQSVTPVQSDDTMAEAGRKILLVDFIKMLDNDAGSRTGEDIEHVHDMRVATRRMRSAFRLFETYYKTKPVRPFIAYLRTLARRLGSVRDLDVMIDDLKKYQTKQDAEAELLLQLPIDTLDKRRAKARKKLINLLDSHEHAEFVAAFSTFLTHPGYGARTPDHVVAPHQVRHVLPAMLHDHLAAVRAYDEVLNDEQVAPDVLHGLRIEFKRLRYATAFFGDVLGASGENFIAEIKTIQDHLGRLNDIVTAQETLQTIQEEGFADSDALAGYLAYLQTEREGLVAGFGEVWMRFNSRTVQSKLSNALLTLR